MKQPLVLVLADTPPRRTIEKVQHTSSTLDRDPCADRRSRACRGPGTARQWETTITAGARDRVLKSCVTAAEANLANGDEKTFQQSVVKTAEDAGCTVRDVKVSGNQVISDATCGGHQNTSTTTYHGDWYEQTSSNGTTVRAKRVGACP